MDLIAQRISKQFSRITKNSSHFYAVQETDFALESGKLTILEGRSGSGKTTMLNMLSGLLAPTSGKIMLGNTDLVSLNDDELSHFRAEHFGVIPQGQSAIGSLTVFENIILPTTIYTNNSSAIEKADDLMKKLGIEHLRDTMPNELSGGEMRRMSIARALIHEPDVIFADEPTGDLDDENTQLVFSILRDIAHSGKAVLLITHEKDAENYADKVFHMSGGVLTEG